MIWQAAGKELLKHSYIHLSLRTCTCLYYSYSHQMMLYILLDIIHGIVRSCGPLVS